MSKAKILIVEDELIVAASLSRQLTKKGYDVINTVNSGDKAIRAVHHECPDIILMDISIRGKLDGIQTADILIHENHNLSVIFLSAFSDLSHMTQAATIRNSHYLVKPFPFRNLLALLDKIMQPGFALNNQWEYMVS